MNPNFLPGGVSDFSIITPLLILAGFYCLPVSVMKKARSIARGTTWGLLCLALSCAILLPPSEAATPLAKTSVPVNTVFKLLGQSSQIQLEHATIQELDYASVSTCDEFAAELSVVEGEDKNKRYVDSLRPRNQNCPHVDCSTSPPIQVQFHRTVISARSHGHQLQLYNSGDESQSFSCVRISPNFFRPPFKHKKGGLFHDLSSSRRCNFGCQSGTNKASKACSFATMVLFACVLNQERCSKGVPTIAESIKPINRWLLHQALLL